MRTARKNQSSKKSKIPKHRMLNKSQYKYKALKTQKGGAAAAAPIHNTLLTGAKVSGNTSAEHTMLESIKQILVAYQSPSVKSLIEKIFAGDNIKYFKLDGSMPDPFIKLADRKGFTPSFYLEWYKSKNHDFKTHATLATEGKDFDTIIEIGEERYSIYETAMAQICRDILIMLHTGKRNMNNNARKPLDFFKKQEKTITKTLTEYDTYPPELQESIGFKNTYKKNELRLPIVKEAIKLLEKSEPTTENIANINLYKNTLELQKEKDLEINSSDLKLESSDLKLEDLLIQCEKCISKGYKYKDVFELIMNYILWLGKRLKPSITFNPDELDKYKTKLSETPFLIFPTYAQISYNYVLFLMDAPIINFRLVNRKRAIHGSMGNSFDELGHDVIFHGNKTHRINLLTEKNYETWFANMSIIISTLYKYFNYEKLTIKEITGLGQTNYDNLNGEQKKQIIAIILFIFLHENAYNNDIIYYLYFNSDLNKTKNPTTIEDICNSIKDADEWPKNIDVKSVIDALNVIFNMHKKELDTPMKNLGEILGLQLPSERPLPLPLPQPQ